MYTKQHNTAHANDLLASLSLADEPLLLGLRLCANNADLSRQAEMLRLTLKLFGRHCSLVAIRELYRLVQRLIRRQNDNALSLLKLLSPDSDIAGERWLQALLLEAVGNQEEALAILEGLTDPDLGDGRAYRLFACARNFLACGRHDEAAYVLRDGIRCACTYRTLQSAESLVDALLTFPIAHIKRKSRIAVVGATTMDLLASVLRVTAFAAGIEADVHAGSIDQYQQEILDPQSSLADFRPDVVIIAPHWQSLGLPEEDENPAATVEATVSTLVNLWRHCRECLHAFVVQHNFERPNVDPYGRLSRSLPGGRSRVLEHINLALWEAEAHEIGVAIVDVEYASAQYGKDRWNDAALWHSAKQYPAADALPFLVRHVISVLQSVWGLSAKCLALDLDGTLWGGTIGEEGIHGIVLGGSGLGEAYVAFQRFLQALGRRGIILTVCSKNNPDDALKVFREHPEMALTEADIAHFEIGWHSKDESIRRLAETANIGLDSIVFLDDSPRERAWVRKQLPEVTVLELPPDPALFIQTLANGLFFESLTITDEDRRRTQSYHENVHRDVLEASSSTVEEFLRSLRMTVELRPFDEEDLPRIVQLINKTNQFNVTTRRRSEAEVRSLLNRGDVYSQAMRLRDRFGDNGLTGVLIAFEDDHQFVVDTWLLSCRVMGRRVEEVMLHSLLRHALERDAAVVGGEYLPTEKNAPVRDLYDRLGFVVVDEDSQGKRRYTWPLAKGNLPLPPFFHVTDQT